MSDHEVPGTIVEMVRYHEKLLLRGNGKPGLCTRMETQENAMDAVTERFDKTDDIMREKFAEMTKDTHNKSMATNKRIDNTQKMFWVIIILLITTLSTTVAELAKDRPRAQPVTQTQSYPYP